MGATDYKRPESVLVVVHTAAGEVLLLRRLSPDNFWQSVTGSLKWGESPGAAALRELREETGITAGAVVAEKDPVPGDANGHVLVDHDKINCFPILPAWRKRYEPGIAHNFEHLFSIELPSPVDIELNTREHSEYCWLPADEAIELASSWTNQDAIAAVVSPKQGME